jgi:hypothetical protein
MRILFVFLLFGLIAACEDKAVVKQKRSVPKTIETNIPTIGELQKGNYRLKILNYPVGDRSMPTGHIEGIVIDENSSPVSHYLNGSGEKCEAFINRSEKKSDYNTMNKRFRNKKYLNEALDTEKHPDNSYRRSVELKLSSKQMEHWLLQSANEDSIKYHLKNDNCADGVCRGLNIHGKPKKYGNTAYPNIVYNLILKDSRVIKGTIRGKGKGVLSSKFKDSEKFVKDVHKILKDITLENIFQ